MEADGGSELGIELFSTKSLKDSLPMTVFHYVSQSHRTEIIFNAMTNERYMADDFVKKHNLKSWFSAGIVSGIPALSH